MQKPTKSKIHSYIPQKQDFEGLFEDVSTLMLKSLVNPAEDYNSDGETEENKANLVPESFSQFSKPNSATISSNRLVNHYSFQKDAEITHIEPQSLSGELLSSPITKEPNSAKV